MNKFCDDHEWTGEQGQFCPECEAMFAPIASPTGRINREGPELQNIKSPYQPLEWNGIIVLKNDMLTGRMMVVSPEVFEMLTETPEQRQAKARALVEKADRLTALCDKLLKEPKL